MKKIFSVLILLAIQLSSVAQTWQDTVVLIEKAFDRYKPTIPGAQLAISRNGEVIFSRAWGMADMEHNVPLTNGSVIEAGSVSKQFTAAAILLLEQQGKLSLGDNVRKYIPELPEYANSITLRHMMQHTSGLKDWGSVAGIAGWPRSTKTYSNDDALDIIAKQKTLNNIPGDEYIYSNSGYNLFAIIVERVSGKSLAEFCRIHIFEPAGLTHTEWRNNFKKIVPNRAIAYEKNGNTYLTDMPNEYAYGNGGLLTTAEDLLRWNNYYLSGKLGSPSLLPKQLATTPLNNGTINFYAAGLRVDSVRGWKYIAHTGATASYRSSLQYFPDLGLSIAWLSNSSEFDNGPNMPNAIRDIMVKNIAVAAKRNPATPYTVSTEKLKSYAGWYRDPKTASGTKLILRNDTLRTQTGTALIPIAENIFMQGQTRVEIQSTTPRKILLISPADTIIYIAADSAQTNEKSLQDYVGEYWSDEAEAKYIVKLKDGKLFAQRSPTSATILTPLYKDGFSTPGTNIFIERNKKGQVTGMKLYVGRARNVEFRKL
ncbi:hypothetical protein CAP36_14370 [Chitinophagaceae bacterium IBVUCB2]|nr:hypothetical protein CAP36_14370 [Chitinophagaceae bacterium IBVUCB2]